MTTRAWVLFALALWLCAGRRLEAQDSPPYLLSEPGEYTDVIDAFEPDDPFDINVSLGFTRSYRSATIERELNEPGDRIAGRYLGVAESSQVTNALSVELDVGLYKDLMAYTRLPLVLSDTRSLSLPDSARCSSAQCTMERQRIEGALGAGDPSSQTALFSLPFDAQTRSGVPSFDLGVAWGIVNQFRTPYLPTWVVSFETRVGVGPIMSPCKAAGSGCGTGINRGTTRIELTSRWSYRLRFIEPYLGLSYVFEWATGASERYTPGGDQPGYLDTSPPKIGETTLGAALIAWEDRARFQRFAFDLRGRAAYVSSGRDYTPLFDALGTSSNASLVQRYETPSKRSAGFTGLSNVDGYARFGLEAALAMQAARYVRFRLGISFWHESAHLLTDAAPCAATGGSACPVDSINALYRPIIDLPGQRFRSSADLTFDLFALATGQF